MNKVKSIYIELLRNNHIESKHEVLITTDKDHDGFEFFPRCQLLIGLTSDGGSKVFWSVATIHSYNNVKTGWGSKNVSWMSFWFLEVLNEDEGI